MPQCVTVIFNPVSGRTNPEERQQAISEALAAHGCTCQFITTTREHGARALAVQAIQEGVDLLAVSGGDGTVMEVLAALVGTDIPVAVLPAGTGNLLSLNLGIPTTVPEAVQVALEGQNYALDLARTQEGLYFAIMGGMGMDAQMIADTDRTAKNQLGKWAYLRAALKNLSRRRTSVEIRLDGQLPIRRRAKTVLIANMGQIAEGLNVLPMASPNDGLLEIGILKAVTPAHWVHLLGSALLGHAHQDPALEVHQAHTVTIRPRHPQPVQLDGEDAGLKKILSVEVVPHAVQILLPPNSPAFQSTPHLPSLALEPSVRSRRGLSFLLILFFLGTLGRAFSASAAIIPLALWPFFPYNSSRKTAGTSRQTCRKGNRMIFSHKQRRLTHGAVLSIILGLAAALMLAGCGGGGSNGNSGGGTTTTGTSTSGNNTGTSTSGNNTGTGTTPPSTPPLQFGS